MQRSISSDLLVIIPVHQLSQNFALLKENLIASRVFDLSILLVLDRPGKSEILAIDSLLNESGIKNVTYISGNYGSAAAARNAGLKNCNACWIGFWDCDDLADPSGYISMMQLAKRTGSDICIGGISIVQKFSTTDFIPAQNIKLFEIAMMPAFTRMIFSHKIISETLFPIHSLGEDQVFLASIFLKKPKIAFYQNVVYKYLQGNSSQVSTRFDHPYDQKLSADIINNFSKIASEKKIFYKIMALRLYLGIFKRQLTGEVNDRTLFLKVILRLFESSYLIVVVFYYFIKLKKKRIKIK
jgi:hypothetical protein